MKNIQQKYWLTSKLRVLFIIISVYCNTGYTQNNTFFIELPNRIVCQDIIEDSKGGIIASIDKNQYRFSHNGHLLWRIYGSEVVRYHAMKDSNIFYYFGLGMPLAGSFEMAKYHLRGARLFYIFDEPANETNGIMDYWYDSTKKIFVVCGWRKFINSDQKYNCWIAGVDLSGNILWENNVLDSGKSKYYNRIFRNIKTNGFILLSLEELKGGLAEWFNVDSVGQIIKRYPLESSPEVGYDAYLDYKIETDGHDPAVDMINDSIIIATIEKPNKELYFYKYNIDLDVLDRKFGGAGSIKRINSSTFIGYAGTGFVVFDIKMIEKYRARIFENDVDEYFYINKLIPSRDGGFIGTAAGSKYIDGTWNNNYVYVFKTDSLGRYQNSGESFEKQQPVMLQPNPARDSVRVAIPFYYGRVNVKIFSRYGQLLQESTQNELDMVSLNCISPGVYFVHATIEETREVRKMKLIVN